MRNVEEIMPDRRQLIRGLAGAACLPVLSTPLGAMEQCRFQQLGNNNNARPKRILQTEYDTYSTYPHLNGFLPDGRLVVARGRPDSNIEFAAINFHKGVIDSELIGNIEDARMYYAVARNGFLVATVPHGFVVRDTHKSFREVVRWVDPEYKSFAESSSKSLKYSYIADIDPSGSRVVTTRVITDSGKTVSSSVVLVELASLKTSFIYDSKPDQDTGSIPPLDHAHFSPFDPMWVCFSNQSSRPLDRIHVWHPNLAPRGRILMEQIKGPTYLNLGHERASTHRLSMLVIAYGSSSGTPRGMYEVDIASGQARLISQSNRDMHCNSGKSGYRAIVSTQGYSQFDEQSDVANLCARAGTLPDDRTSKGSDIYLVDMVSGNRSFLYRTQAGSAQPYEAQPALSPDERWAVIKSAVRNNVILVQLDQ